MKGTKQAIEYGVEDGIFVFGCESKSGLTMNQVKGIYKDGTISQVFGDEDYSYHFKYSGKGELKTRICSNRYQEIIYLKTSKFMSLGVAQFKERASYLQTLNRETGEIICFKTDDYLDKFNEKKRIIDLDLTDSGIGSKTTKKEFRKAVGKDDLKLFDATWKILFPGKKSLL